MSKDNNEWTTYDDHLARAQRLFVGHPFDPRGPAPAAAPVTVTERLLTDAAGVINGGRRDVNGNPERSFTTIADFWNAYIEALRMKQGNDSPRLTGSDVAQMMELLKMARGVHGNRGERDHYLDRIGYAALAYEQEARKE